LPSGCRAGDNGNAFSGGFCLWQKADERVDSAAQNSQRKQTHKEGSEGK